MKLVRFGKVYQKNPYWYNDTHYFIEIVDNGLPSNEGCSDQELGSSQESESDSSSMISLSEFSYTPTNSPTNSLTDDEGGAQQEQAHSPDQIQMDVEIPRVQVTG